MTLVPEDLEAFLIVMREGSFGRAARSLLVSQPTISERIARLERSVGVELFVRGPRGVSLTHSGERLSTYAERIVGLMDEAVDAVSSADRPTPLRIGVHSTFAYRVVPLVVGTFENPTRSLTVRDAHSDQIIALLLDGAIDAGFVLPGARPPGLRFDSLRADPVVCVCSPAHQLAEGRSVAFRSLTHHELAVNFWGSASEEFRRKLEAVPATSRRVECSDAGSALGLARERGYLAFVAQSAAESDIAAGTLTRLKLRGAPNWSVTLVLASRAKGVIDSDVESLRRAVRGWATS